MDWIKNASATASQGVSDAATLPTHLLSSYDDFVTKNASSVSQIESALRSLTYIIPGRFRESELASESLHSTIQLLSIYHDSLLAKAVSRLPAAQRPTPSLHNRYTAFWTARSPRYRQIALLLQMVQCTELLIEMTSRRRGPRSRWRAVVMLETVKAVCRLWLLRLTRSRPLVSPPLPVRDVDPASLAPADEEELELDLQHHQHHEKPEIHGWDMPRTGLTLPSLPPPGDVTGYLLSKVLTLDDLKAPKRLLHQAAGAGQVAEVLYILRPVIYALALQRWASTSEKGKGKANWRPWLLGLSIEYGARQLAKQDLRQRLAGGLGGLTGLEKEELQRRGWGLGWWALRGAFYENITRPYLTSFAARLKDKPLIGLLGGIVEDYEYLWSEYYFSTTSL